MITNCISQNIRPCSIILLAFIFFGSSQFAFATDISDVPLTVKYRAEPNLMFVLDDSGSMDGEILIAGHNGGALWWSESGKGFSSNGNLYKEPGTDFFGLSLDSWHEYNYLFPNGSAAGARVLEDEGKHYAVAPTKEFAFIRSHEYNPLYYNPFIVYRPWLPYHNGSTWVSFQNADPKAARSHPMQGSLKHDLTQNINNGSANWTFRLYPGATRPDGSKVGFFAQDLKVSYYAPTYYLKDPNGTDAVAYDGQKLKKYEIKPGNSFPSGRSYEREMQNFANWFTYYRKRTLATAAALGNVIAGGEGFRAGVVKFNNLANAKMHSINTGTDPVPAGQFLKEVYSAAVNGGTPTHKALDYAGRQFMRKDANAPIQYACQHNSALVVTDGYASPNETVRHVGNADGDASNPYNISKTAANPYKDSYSNTLADIAMYYYWQNLRSDLDAGKVPTEPSYLLNPDLNPDPHMNTYGLTLGVMGPKRMSGLDPFTTNPNWTYVSEAYAAESLDDLWHGTINSRGEMYAASSQESIKESIQDIVSRVKSRTAGGAALAVSNQIPKTGDNSVFVSSFVAGAWSGDLKAHTVNTVTGVIDTTKITWTKGSAQTQLDSTVVTPSSRKIATFTNGKGEPFILAKLTVSEREALDTPGRQDRNDVLQYIRGNRALEANKPNGRYRPRASRLGDIVSAEPVFVGDPSANYTDNGYAAFKSQNTGRRRMVYQGANDGMLHAFDAHPTEGGDEEWAYIPGLVLKNLNNLSKAAGFSHTYYVNATPVVGDADLSNTYNAGSSAPNWKTLLVGGLGKGGRGFYALNVTSPTAATEGDVAAKVLWEIGPDPVDPADPTTSKDAFGYSFGKPVIAKTKAAGWVVLVTSGYNNDAMGGDGFGRLYVLNAKDGKVIKVLKTEASGTSGLAQISAVAATDGNLMAAYGGDLLGNLWRFNLKGNTVAEWTVTKMAQLKNANNEAQPITVAPEIGLVDNKLMIFVGTGRYLGDVDVPGSTTATVEAKQVQSFYGLYDSATEITPLRSSLVQRTLEAGSAGAYKVKDTTEKISDKSGWFMDLTLGQGERVVTDPQLALGTLVFSTNLPSVAACEPGGKSWLYALNYATGGLAEDVDGPATWSVQPLSNSITFRPVLIQVAGGNKLEAGFRNSNGETTTPPIPFKPGVGSSKRISWREVIGE